jgi:hypothetical protein
MDAVAGVWDGELPAVDGPDAENAAFWLLATEATADRTGRGRRNLPRFLDLIWLRTTTRQPRGGPRLPCWRRTALAMNTDTK